MIAVIGLGGTGAYILDFIVKTPVREIRTFDLDPFCVHNAFRSPGRLEETELGQSKAEVYLNRYENFRTGLSATPMFIDASCDDDLEGVTLAFVCVDKGSPRAGIFDLLISKGIPFIDVGMGLDRKRGPLNGMVRATYYSAEHAQEVRDKGLGPAGGQSRGPIPSKRSNQRTQRAERMLSRYQVQATARLLLRRGSLLPSPPGVGRSQDGRRL